MASPWSLPLQMGMRDTCVHLRRGEVRTVLDAHRALPDAPIR